MAFPSRSDPDNTFTLHTGNPVTVNVSASAPRVFYTEFNPDQVERVSIEMTSNSSICSYLAVQEAHCPISDLVSTVQYGNYYQSVMLQGSVTLDTTKFPSGKIFVMVLVLPTDELCTGGSVSAKHDDRVKSVTLDLKVSISPKEYYLGIFIPLAVYLLFIVASVVILKTRLFACVQMHNSDRDALITEGGVYDNADSVRSETEASSVAAIEASAVGVYDDRAEK